MTACLIAVAVICWTIYFYFFRYEDVIRGSLCNNATVEKAQCVCEADVLMEHMNFAKFVIMLISENYFNEIGGQIRADAAIRCPE